MNRRDNLIRETKNHPERIADRVIALEDRIKDNDNNELLVQAMAEFFNTAKEVGIL
jgi:hypothetical protein